MACKNIIIIGAPRSGTNMLRDSLTELEGVSTWPCDEINYIWRHGNVGYSSDEFSVDNASYKAKKYIRSQFLKLQKQTNAKFIVEKTCANSLRVPFVDRVIPQAKYVYIVRDGIDVIGSAKLRWTAKLDIPYILKKVRYVPKLDLPYYASRYLFARIYRLFSAEKRLSFWGPSLSNMQELLQRHTLNEVCGLQWKRCVDKSDEAFAEIPEENMIKIKYEEFVETPLEHMKHICDFLGIETSRKQLLAATKMISSRSVGKGRANLSKAEIKKLENLLYDTLAAHDYV